MKAIRLGLPIASAACIASADAGCNSIASPFVAWSLVIRCQASRLVFRWAIISQKLSPAARALISSALRRWTASKKTVDIISGTQGSVTLSCPVVLQPHTRPASRLAIP